MPDLVYESIPKLTQSEIKGIISRNEPNELLVAVLAAALYSEDRVYAAEVCTSLSDHPHFNVRGNAILGFAHIARMDGELDESTVKPIILNALSDEHEYVRGHAFDAKEDIEHYLGWKF